MFAGSAAQPASQPTQPQQYIYRDTNTQIDEAVRSPRKEKECVLEDGGVGGGGCSNGRRCGGHVKEEVSAGVLGDGMGY